MTAIVHGFSDHFFYSKEEVVDYLLKNILKNKKRWVGTEWEMFFVDQDSGAPITREKGQEVFNICAKLFSRRGYHVQYQVEDANDGSTNSVGLDIQGLGSIQLEAGHQFEFACAAAETCAVVDQRNRVAHAVLTEAARQIRHNIVFAGHRNGYAETTQGVNRSRGVQWDHYYKKRFGNSPENAAAFRALREAQHGTASVQVTLDAGADKFHEFFKALLIIEPALTLQHTNSLRPSISVQGYGQFIPSQVKPISDVWKAQSPRAALEIIVDRLMRLEVPFLPNPNAPNTYIAEQLDVNMRPPTVQNLMDQGRLSELNLNGVASFFYTRPALRAVVTGLLEVRGMDSQSRPESVDAIAKEVTALVYDDSRRKKLLVDYAYLTTNDINELHSTATKRKPEALATIVAGRTMADYVKDIIGRANGETSAHANFAIGHTRKKAPSVPDNGGTKIQALATAAPS